MMERNKNLKTDVEIQSLKTFKNFFFVSLFKTISLNVNFDKYTQNQ